MCNCGPKRKRKNEANGILNEKIAEMLKNTNDRHQPIGPKCQQIEQDKYKENHAYA